MDKARRATGNSRPTIGLLISATTDPVAWAVWMGISDIAQERGANLICFTGEALRSPVWFEAQANVLYNLAGAENVDGLIVWGGGLAQYVDAEEVRILCEGYRPLPVVNGALLLKGIPSILVDNYLGVRDAMVHLIEVHGYHRIAFIRGPEGHPEAEERYRAYTDALAKYGLPLDADLVAPGEFSAPSGAAAIDLLLDQREIDFEAVVAVDDATAIGVMDALQSRGIRIPGDVAIAGFDDVEEAKFVVPSLTTVRQPMYELGKQAAEMVLALMAGGKVPEQVTLPTKLVVRRSCGCLTPGVMMAAAGPVTKTDEMFEVAFAARREEIFSAMVRVMGATPDSNLSEKAEQFLDAFAAELTGESPGVFLPTLDELLCQEVIAGGNVDAWQGALSALRRHALPCLGTDEILSQAEDLWQQARVLVGEKMRQMQASQGVLARQYVMTWSEIGGALTAAFEMEELLDVIAQELPRLGIPSCYLSLYEQHSETLPGSVEALVEGGLEKPPERSRLILAYNEKGRIELEPGGRRFLSHQLAPEGMLPHARQFNVLVEPLYFGKDQLGFIILEAGPREGAAYEAMREQLSIAFKGILLLQEREQAEEALRESEERYRTLVNQAPIGVITCDRTGNITHVNPALLQVLGSPSEEATRQFNMLTMPELVEAGVAADIRRCMEEAIQITAEYPYRSYWGKDSILYMRMIPLRDESGAVSGVLGTVEDVTEQRRLQERLVHSAKLASIGELAAGVAHEINNPINGIINYAQLLLNKAEEDSRHTRFLEGILREGDRVAAIVRDLLIFARVEKEAHSPAHVIDILQATLTLSGQQLKKDGIILEIQEQPGLPQIKCRSQRIQQVFLNLISNARDALNARYLENDPNKRLVIRIEQIEKEGQSHVRTTFHDQGEGIPAHNLGRIFTPFFTTKRPDEGTGLGLSVSYGIVQDHHGDILVESVEGDAAHTIFRVDLPVDPGWAQSRVAAHHFRSARSPDRRRA